MLKNMTPEEAKACLAEYDTDGDGACAQGRGCKGQGHGTARALAHHRLYGPLNHTPLRPSSPSPSPSPITGVIRYDEFLKMMLGKNLRVRISPV